jgi:hypothetical protein
MKHVLARSRSVLLPIAVVTIVCLFGPVTNRALAAARNLTVVVNPAGGGITIVDQVSGVVTHCGIKANFPNNTASCVRAGKVTPNATVPTAPVGLSVFLAQTITATGSVVDTPGIWLVNNSTGDLTYCNAIDYEGTPSGSCTDLGIASST